MSILSNRPDKGNRKKHPPAAAASPSLERSQLGRGGDAVTPLASPSGDPRLEAYALIVDGSAQEKSHPAVTFDEIRRLAGGAKLVLLELEMMLDELPELDEAKDRQAFAALARNSITTALASLARMTPAPGNMVRRGADRLGPA